MFFSSCHRRGAVRGFSTRFWSESGADSKERFAHSGGQKVETKWVRVESQLIVCSLSVASKATFAAVQENVRGTCPSAWMSQGDISDLSMHPDRRYAEPS